MKKVLMHVCCAPCFVMIEEDIQKNGMNINGKREQVDLTAFWYNPNIHPQEENKLRLEAFKKLCGEDNIKSVIIDECEMKEFTNITQNEVGTNKRYKLRCEYCYYLRLEKTFEYAKENGYDIVSTSLTRSPYQNHELINKIAQILSKKYGVEYSYQDYRHTYFEGQQRARERGLYMQKYCGCIFSSVESLLQKKLSKYLKRMNIKPSTKVIQDIIEDYKKENNGTVNIEKIVNDYKEKSTNI